MPEAFCDCLTKRGSIPPPDQDAVEPFRTPVQIPSSAFVQIGLPPTRTITLDDIPTDDVYFYNARVRLLKSIRYLAAYCKTGDKLLDVGGGEKFGELVSFLGVEYKYVNGSHMDLRTSKLNYPADSFDIVICWETIEHMWQVNRNGNLGWDGVLNCWNECYRVLKPGGHFSLTTTNRLCPRTYRSIQQGLCQQIFPAVCTPRQIREGHVREFSGDEILALMTHGGENFVDYTISSDDCYSHVYDMSAEMYIQWKKDFESFLDRPLKKYEQYDTLFFDGKKPHEVPNH
jgi:SAM-dependent methyltransferase